MRVIHLFRVAAEGYGLERNILCTLPGLVERGVDVIALIVTEHRTGSALSPEFTAQLDEAKVRFINITVEGYPRLNGWLLTVMFIGLSALLVFWAGNQLQSLRWGWRWGLCVLLGGLLGYNYVALGLPGSAEFALSSGLSGVLGISAIGELLGLGIAWLWSRLA